MKGDGAQQLAEAGGKASAVVAAQEELALQETDYEHYVHHRNPVRRCAGLRVRRHAKWRRAALWVHVAAAAWAPLPAFRSSQQANGSAQGRLRGDHPAAARVRPQPSLLGCAVAA